MKRPIVWIIESNTRGTFVEWRQSRKDWRMMAPGFSTMGSRLDGKCFPDEASARAELAKIAQHVENCYIMELGNGSAQIAYDTRGFVEVTERQLDEFLWKNKLSGKAFPIDGGMQWSANGRVVARTVFRRATKQDHRYLLAEVIDSPAPTPA